jgi:gliding motility associated protien GldN
MRNLFILLCVVVAQCSLAQSNLLNAKSPDEFNMATADEKESDNDKPLEYGYIAKRDILWQRVVWETIDLDERVNFPLLYPTEEGRLGDDRKSLFKVLTDAAKAGDIKIYADSYFVNETEASQVESSLTLQKISDRGREIMNEYFVVPSDSVSPLDIDTVYNIPDFDQYVETTKINADDVKAYNIRGVWYFDARQSELRYRLLGIAPVTTDVSAKAGLVSSDADVELFWVFYPDAREILHKAKAFNSGNAARPLSFDHLLNSRRFNALITRVDNVYGDRDIKEYIKDNSMMALLEAERLKEEIRNFELEMWNN